MPAIKCLFQTIQKKLKQYRIYSLTITQLNEKAIAKYAENHSYGSSTTHLQIIYGVRKKNHRVAEKIVALNDKENTAKTKLQGAVGSRIKEIHKIYLGK